MRRTVRLFAACSALLAFVAFGAQAQKAASKPPKVKITAAQAQKVALKKYPGKVVGKVPLENEEGKWQYAVSIKSGKVLREVMVDANTGKIANVEVTTAAKEAAEAKRGAVKGKKAGAKARDEEDEKEEKDEKGGKR